MVFARLRLPNNLAVDADQVPGLQLLAYSFELLARAFGVAIARACAADLEDRYYGLGNAGGGSLTSLTTPIARKLVMSALTPIADIGTQSCDVRFVPKADKVQCSKKDRYSITSSAVICKVN
jgi:hypothetical protein